MPEKTAVWVIAKVNGRSSERTSPAEREADFEKAYVDIIAVQ